MNEKSNRMPGTIDSTANLNIGTISNSRERILSNQGSGKIYPMFNVSHLAGDTKIRPLTSNVDSRGARNMSRQTAENFKSEFGGRSSAQDSSASAML